MPTHLEQLLADVERQVALQETVLATMRHEQQPSWKLQYAQAALECLLTNRRYTLKRLSIIA